MPGASGGTGGNNGANYTYSSSTTLGGGGQGTSVWSSILLPFNSCAGPLNVTAGSGGVTPASLTMNSTYNYGGGGGGGGIIINGAYLLGGAGTAPLYAGPGGVGYGAGGGGGGCYQQTGYAGGNGAAGACVIIWST